MHRPAPADVDLHLGRAAEEAPELGAQAERLKAELAEGRMEAAAGALPRVEAVVDAAALSPAAERSARKGLGDIGDALGGDAYWRQPTWKKVAVIFAGPATNVVFAILALAVVYMLGVPTEVTRTVDSVSPGLPAAAAGLRAGDEIVAVNGEPVRADEISATIRASDGAPLRLTVLRDGVKRGCRRRRRRRSKGRYDSVSRSRPTSSTTGRWRR